MFTQNKRERNSRHLLDELKYLKVGAKSLGFDEHVTLSGGHFVFLVVLILNLECLK